MVKRVVAGMSVSSDKPAGRSAGKAIGMSDVIPGSDDLRDGIVVGICVA